MKSKNKMKNDTSMEVEMKDRFTKQREHYMTVIETRPTHPITLNALIMVSLILGDDEGAGEYNQQYCSLRDDFTNGQFPGLKKPVGKHNLENFIREESGADIPSWFIFEMMSEIDINDSNYHMMVGMHMLQSGYEKAGNAYIEIAQLIDGTHVVRNEDMPELIAQA